MEYFDVSDIIASYEAELSKHDSRELNTPLDPDPEKGLKQIADLLTFLPEEQRVATVKAFVNVMLND